MNQSGNGVKKTVSTNKLETVQVRISLNVEIVADETGDDIPKRHVLLHNEHQSLKCLSRTGIIEGVEAAGLQYAIDSCRLEILQNSSTQFEQVRRSVDDIVNQMKEGQTSVLATLHLS